MLWIIPSIVCAAYFVAVRYMAQSQQMPGIWLILALLFFVLFIYRWYFRRHPEKKKQSLRIRTFCITSLILFLIMTGVVAGRILADIWSSPEGEPRYILLLNQSGMSDETDQEWQDRMQEAVRYLETHEQARVIVSGGWDEARGYSEAHAMYVYLQEQGINGNRISWEIRSQNTKENLDYARTICGGDRFPVGIVSSDYSMYRTLRVARNQGYIQAEPIPSPTTAWLYPHRIAQEILQVLRDKFLGI